MADELVNRIGIGVGMDGTEQVLTDLKSIQHEVRSLVDLTRSAPASITRSNQTIQKETRATGQDRLGELIKRDVQAQKEADKEKAASAKSLDKELTRLTEQGNKQRIGEVNTFFNAAEKRAKESAAVQAKIAKETTQATVKEAQLSIQEIQKLERLFKPDPQRQPAAHAIYEAHPEEYLKGQAAIYREGYPERERAAQQRDKEIAAAARAEIAKQEGLANARALARVNRLRQEIAEEEKLTREVNREAEAERKRAQAQANKGGGGGGSGGGGGTGGGGGGGNPPNANPPPPRSIFQRGLFGYGGQGGLGSITASILTRDLIRGTIKDTEQLIKTSIQSAQAQAAAQVELEAASRASGRAAQSNLDLADSIHKQFNVSRTIADETVAAVQRLTAASGAFGKESGLVKIFENIAAARGVAQKDLPKLIDEAQNETSRFTEKYLNESSETIFRKYAARNRSNLERAGVNAGLDKEPTTNKELAATLTEYEKKQAIVQELQAQGGKFANEAIQRQDSLAGSMDKTRARIDDITASIGRFLLTNRTIVNLLERAADVLSHFAPDAGRPGGSGPGGLLTGADIQQRGLEYANSTSAQLSRSTQQAADTAFLPVALLARLLGQGNDAPAGRKIEGYGRGIVDVFKNYGDDFSQYGRDVNEGQARAIAARRGQLGDLRAAGRLSYLGPDGQVVYSDDPRVNRRDAQGNLQLPQGYKFRQDAQNQPLVEDEKVHDERLKRASDLKNTREREAQAEDAAFNQFMGNLEKALGKLDELEKSLPNIFTAFAEATARDNPFIKPLVQLETVVQRVKEQYGELSEGIQQRFVGQERTNALLDIANARVDAQVNSYKALVDAKRVELSIGLELTGQEERRLKVFEAQAQAAAKIPGLLFQASVLDKGYANPQESRNAFYRTYQGLRNLQDQGGTGLFGRKQTEIADEAFRQFANQIPQKQLWSDEPIMKEIRHRLAETNRNEVERLEAQIQDEMKRAKVGDTLAQDAQRQVDLIRRNTPEQIKRAEAAGLGGEDLARFRRELEDSQRKRVLATIGSLSEKERTPELRQAQVEALKQEAQAQLEYEQRAEQARDTANALLGDILSEIRVNRGALSTGDVKSRDELTIRIENNSRAEATKQRLKAAREDYNTQADARDSKNMQDAVNAGLYGPASQSGPPNIVGGAVR